ncbi:MAG TPA: nickel-dependent lactate racemase [Candidatus Acidoferrales bacterium]|nr:nickel-dependent lactate racemase [Candidatus Acidoferrales bacterium]
MKIRLDYGRTGLDANFPDQINVSIVDPPRGRPLADPTGAIEAALAQPMGASPLGELARGKRNAVVVISDKTRPVPYGTVLPPLLRTLESAGIARERIELLVATGLHRSNTADELAEMTSSELLQTYRFRNHVARNADEHLHLGRTTRGTEIWLDRGFVESDLKVVTGLIEPHLMAGYSGGRKAVAPGLAGVETMRRAHGPKMLEDNVGPGIVDGNPFHADLMEIARRAAVDFMLDVSIDRERRVTGVYAGDIEQAHAAGMADVERHVRVDLEIPADVVVASAGGYPLDQTFYQSIKGLTAALNIVRRGGTIILVAALSEGVGSQDFQTLLSDAQSNDEYMAQICSAGFFRVDQWMVQHLCQVRRKAQVIVVTDGLAPDRIRGLMGRWAPSVEDAMREMLQRYGRQMHVAVIPQGPYVLPTVRGRKLPLGRAWMDDAV